MFRDLDLKDLKEHNAIHAFLTLRPPLIRWFLLLRRKRKQMSIPKIIHYCWFGGGEKNQLITDCMATWEHILPDYEIRCWSEKDIAPLADNRYLRQALEAGQWAFVSDVVRLYALYRDGGIYLDTDVEVLRPFDDFLNLDFFIGSEKNDKFESIGTAVIGAAKGCPIIKDMLHEYDNIGFVKDNGLFDQTTNTVRLVDVLLKHGAPSVYTTDQIIPLGPRANIYPVSYFCQRSPQGYCVHHFNFSWRPAYKRKNKWHFCFGGRRYTLAKMTIRHPEAEVPIPNNEEIIFNWQYLPTRSLTLKKKK